MVRFGLIGILFAVFLRSASSAGKQTFYEVITKYLKSIIIVHIQTLLIHVRGSVSTDGVERGVVVINLQMPAPSIQVQSSQRPIICARNFRNKKISFAGCRREKLKSNYGFPIVPCLIHITFSFHTWKTKTFCCGY